jgi:hypothetical protein
MKPEKRKTAAVLGEYPGLEIQARQNDTIFAAVDPGVRQAAWNRRTSIAAWSLLRFTSIDRAAAKG